ncbi:MAG: TerY-C metal binding domain-containing protein [Mariprofundales bacterium]
MRRLPIFFVLDVSESMVGVPLQQMENGIEKIVTTLRQDPHSLETVYISLIAFAGQAKAITPLIDLISFYPPKMPIGGGTSLGTALDVLMQEIDSKVVKTTMEERGDWEPIVFLITDGKPTDKPQKAVNRWKEKYASHAAMVAITLGKNADIQILKQLTDNVLTLEGSSDEDFRKFIEWVSASVKAQSQQVESNSTGISLAKAKDAGLTVIDNGEQFSNYDTDYVILTGRCSKNKKPYLIKYAKIQTAGMEQFIKNDYFSLEGGFALDDSYFEWSSKQSIQESVNTSVLDGAPPCPSCGNQISFAVCECERILCMDDSGFVTCPWCEKNLKFDMNSGSGGDDFNVNRGQG